MRRFKLLLIRHGTTKGNMEHRYVGSTDEGLVDESRADLESKRDILYKVGSMTGKDILDKTEYVDDIGEKKSSWYNFDKISLYVSPLRRCIETTEILFPGHKYRIVEDFRECDFGRFEYMNYDELKDNSDYQRFIDSMGECGFPAGETKQEFIERTGRAFLEAVSGMSLKEDADTIAIVAHGGTIMAVMDVFSKPHKDYYDWQVGCGEGYAAELLVEDGYFEAGSDRQAGIAAQGTCHDRGDIEGITALAGLISIVNYRGL